MRRPPLEVLRHTFYDTRELPESGCTQLNFFGNPNYTMPGLSNWNASGMMEHPKHFFLYGLLLNLYTVDALQDVVVLRDDLKALVKQANLGFKIEHHEYLDVPVTSTVNGLLPSDAPKVYKNMFQVPYLRAEDFQPDGRLSFMEKDDVFLEDFEGLVVNPEPGDYFYGMCIFRNDKQAPVHISNQQRVEAMVFWAHSPEYKTEILGRVFVRISMLGVLLRPLQ